MSVSECVCVCGRVRECEGDAECERACEGECECGVRVCQRVRLRACGSMRERV